LTYAEDHPGEDLPAFHFAFKVIANSAECPPHRIDMLIVDVVSREWHGRSLRQLISFNALGI
jgi:hypothetical protein